jgi:sarcosine oxidase
MAAFGSCTRLLSLGVGHGRYGRDSLTRRVIPILFAMYPFFGVPGNHLRGFKIADDTRGPVIDPSTMEREISQEKLSTARAYLRMRFPALADSPLLESRVCQYENSTDHNFILDRHPEAQNVWLVGGGSGHGFKHGPVMGEMVAEAVMGTKDPPVEMGLARLLEKH